MLVRWTKVSTMVDNKVLLYCILSSSYESESWRRSRRSRGDDHSISVSGGGFERWRVSPKRFKNIWWTGQRDYYLAVFFHFYISLCYSFVIWRMKVVAVGDQKVLLVHTHGQFSAVGSQCSHYNAPLVKGKHFSKFLSLIPHRIVPKIIKWCSLTIQEHWLVTELDVLFMVRALMSELEILKSFQGWTPFPVIR